MSKTSKKSAARSTPPHPREEVKSLDPKSATQNSSSNGNETGSQNKPPHKEKIEIIATILGIIAILYPVIKYACNFIYQVKCQDFYHIPGNYFSTSVNGSLFYVVLLIALVSIPFLYMRYESKIGGKVSSYIFVGFLSCLVGSTTMSVNLNALSSVLTFQFPPVATTLISWLNAHSVFTLISLIIISVAPFLLFIYFPLLHFKKPPFKTIISALLIVFTLTDICLTGWSTYHTISMSPETKIKYEIAVYEGEHYLVLSKPNEKVLAVKYSLNTSNQYIFNSNTYWLLDESDCSFSYLRMDTPPIYGDLGNSTVPKSVTPSE